MGPPLDQNSKFGQHAGLSIIITFAAQHSMWDLSSPTRDRTHARCTSSMDRHASPQGSYIKEAYRNIVVSEMSAALFTLWTQMLTRCAEFFWMSEGAGSGEQP